MNFVYLVQKKMKTTLTLSILILTSTWLPAQSTESRLEKMEWLCKTWKRTDVSGDKTAYEIWTRDGDALRGKGYTLNGADTVFVEQLSIVVKDDALFYVSEVSHNPAPVYFEIEITGLASFISRNPKHDFPKEIEYNLVGDELTATISGDGKKVPFKFKLIQ